MSLLVRFCFQHAPASIASDLRQPVVVVTNWHWYGAGLFAILFAACALATLAYVAGLRDAPGSRAPSILWMVGLCATAIACAWLAPAIFSSDVYAYAAYGEMVRLGSNPYAHAVLPSGNSIFDAAIWQWGNPLPACVYGPAFVAIAAVIASAAHGLPTVVTLDALRLVASLALLICVPLACLSYGGSGAQRLTAAATIALNPTTLWCVAEGHNDAIALAIVLGGCAVVRRRPALGAALAALSGTIKLPGIAAGAAIGYRDRHALAGAALGTLATLALSAPLLVGVATQLAPHGRFAPQASFEAIVKPLLFLVVREDRSTSILAVAIALAAAAACATAAIRQLRRGRLEGWSYAAIGGWLLVPNPYPWYALWLLPIAALAPGRRASLVLVLLSLASLLRYVPDAVDASTPAMQLVLGIAATLPVVLLFSSHRGNSRAS